MAKISVGDVIKIRCEVKPGPFSDEKLVSFQTMDGPISGFVRSSELEESDNGWSIRGVVHKVHTDKLEVMVKGSFFTTNGLANLPLDGAIAA